jgi:hypothetical protein
MTAGMDEKNDQHSGKPAGGRKAEAEFQAERRAERLAQTLRDNLQKRKQQSRARRAGDADETSGLPAAKTDESDA